MTKSLTKLSPIQGTPTKQEKTISEFNAKGRDSSRSSPTKTPNKSLQKYATSPNKKENMNKNSNNKERIVSPSKIPIKMNKTNGSSIKSAEQPSQTIQIELESKDKNLINLLKQTATNANSTSSERLVNTTTTTAVQPLQIDAVNSVLTERNDSPSNPKERSEGMSKSSASKDALSVPIATSGAPLTTQNSALLENHSAKASTSANYKKDVHGLKPNDGRASGNQSSAKRREDQEANSTTSTEISQVKSDSTERKMAANRETLETNKMLPTVIENNPQIASQERKAVMATTKTNSTATNDATMADKAASSNYKGNSAIDAEKASVNSKGVLSKNGIRGSQGSLGSTGMSVDSIMSYKSTDTGVSLNTFVRVSSPREKVGVHVMKRPQEIKTLSGDIVREEDKESEKKRR